MKSLKFTLKGIDSLLINNPQKSDPLNKYAKEMKQFTSKRKKTDEDIVAMREIELRSKIYWDDELKIYIPSTWIVAAIAGISWTKGKIKKSDIRSSVFPTKPKIKLSYDGMEKVSTPVDIVKNSDFHNVVSLKQGQVRVVKAAPIFNNWSAEIELDYDDSVINLSELKTLLEHSACYGGFGDFRPTHGRATVDFLD